MADNNLFESAETSPEPVPEGDSSDFPTLARVDTPTAGAPSYRTEETIREDIEQVRQSLRINGR